MQRLAVAAVLCLATLANAQESLTVSVDQTSATVTKTIKTETCTAIEGVVLGCVEETKTAAPTVTQVAVISCQVPNGVILRASSPTTTVTTLGPKVFSVATPGSHSVVVTGIGITDGSLTFFDTKLLQVTVGTGPNPPPPPPDPTVENVYGCGQPAYEASRGYNPTERTVIAGAYKNAALFLYGQPTLKYLTQPDDPNHTNPEKSVFAWLATEVPGEFYEALRQPIIAGQKVYCQDGICTQQFLKSDWYNLLNEIAAGAEK